MEESKTAYVTVSCQLVFLSVTLQTMSRALHDSGIVHADDI